VVLALHELSAAQKSHLIETYYMLNKSDHSGFI